MLIVCLVQEDAEKSDINLEGDEGDQEFCQSFQQQSSGRRLCSRCGWKRKVARSAWINRRAYAEAAEQWVPRMS